MKNFLFLLLIVAAFIIYMNFDGFIEKINDLKNPTFKISVLNPSVENDGVLTFKVLLENLAESPIYVDTLEISYIVLVDRTDIKNSTRKIIVRKTIDKKDELLVYAILPDYANPELDSEASTWVRSKKEKFGIKISAKNNLDKTIKWVKRKIAI